MKKSIVLLFIILMLSVPLSAMADGLGNSIIIYFDYSENIVTDGLDVDAVSSASVAEGPGVRDIGNLLVMVDQIEQRSGATIYPIHITEKYAPITPRRFRTTVLTDLYDATKDIKQAQRAAGHTTAAMTLKHYVKGRQERANTAAPIAGIYFD